MRWDPQANKALLLPVILVVVMVLVVMVEVPPPPTRRPSAPKEPDVRFRFINMILCWNGDIIYPGIIILCCRKVDVV